MEGSPHRHRELAVGLIVTGGISGLFGAGGAYIYLASLDPKSNPHPSWWVFWVVVIASAMALGTGLVLYFGFPYISWGRFTGPPPWRNQIAGMDHKQVSHLEALEHERVGYVARGLWKRVREVDVQIGLARDLWWEKPSPALEAMSDFNVSPEPFGKATLKGDPVRLVVENRGPESEFEAIVEQVMGAEDEIVTDGASDRLAFPWNARWRDSTSARKTIARGQRWLLEIAREDVMHGATEKSWTPQWIYLSPSAERALRAKSLAWDQPGARESYYQEVLVTVVKVFPIGNEDRAVTMTGEFSMSSREGAKVRWR